MTNDTPKEFFEFGGGDGSCDIFMDEADGYLNEYVRNEFGEIEIADDDIANAEFKDDTFNDIDFSQLTGDFKSSLKKINAKSNARRRLKGSPKKVIVPSDRPVIVQGKTKKTSIEMRKQPKHDGTLEGKRRYFSPTPEAFSQTPKGIGVEKRATIIGKDGKRVKSRVLVPDDRKVIVQGVSKFILSKGPLTDTIKNIGYYQGKRLKEMVLIFNNDSELDFNLELFNTSMPLDYLQSTSLNLNDKISVAGNPDVSYSDVLQDVASNPTLMVNAKFTFTGPTVVDQMNQPLYFKNKESTGKEKIQPLQVPLMIDTMQFANNIVFFDIMEQLNRAYVPGPMDVIQYKILPGMTVTFAFFYKQVSLKKLLLKEARDSKGLY